MTTTFTPIEKRPRDRQQWTQLSLASVVGPTASAWSDGHLQVISSLEHADYPDGSGDAGLQWVLSVSERRGGRLKDTNRRSVLRAFDMVGAEEDNHYPGVARKFWLPVDPQRRVPCSCKADEITVEDPDGMKWTTPVDGPCRGCQYEQATGRPCSLHTLRRMTSITIDMKGAAPGTYDLGFGTVTVPSPDSTPKPERKTTPSRRAYPKGRRKVKRR